MRRTFVIIRHTFLDSIAQPIFPLLMMVGAVTLAVFAVLPFFTLGEDTLMYKSVGLDIILLFALLAALFTASKSIHEEVEDRTMLTLMSKPLHRWEVILGKYLGIVLGALLSVGVMGMVLIVCTWLRIPGDYLLRAGAFNKIEAQQISDYRLMHIAGLLPSLTLAWLQVSVLAAVSIALSTRFSLVVNLPVVILLYIAGNLMRFLFPLSTGMLAGRPVAQSGAWVLSLLLPYLQVFDLRKLAILGVVRVSGTQFENSIRAVDPGALWKYVGVATVYAVGYAGFALSAGLLMFHRRELGGGDE